jgi:hypothetical protein
MNTEFIAIIKTLIAEQCREALLNTAKCKALLADYARGEYKKESRLLLQAIEAGVAKEIDATDELNLCKQRQVRVLHDEYFLAPEMAADVVDMLAAVLRGDTTQIQPAAQPSSPQPVAAPSQTAPVQQTTTQIADAPSASVPMPQKKNGNVLLLVAVIFGILFMIFIATGESFLNAILDRKISEITIQDKKIAELPQMVLVNLGDEIAAANKEYSRIRDMKNQLKNQMAFQLEIAKLAKLLLIPLLFAVILNMYAWVEFKAKTTLAAGILYVISLNIISAVLCFIAYDELKKSIVCHKRNNP